MSARPHPTLRRFATEFGVIVLGVLCALSIEEAREAVRDRADAREYLGALRAESAENLGDVERLVGRARAIRTDLERALTLVEVGRDPAAPDSTLEAVAEAVTFSASVPQVSFAVTEDLIGTGSLRLIQPSGRRRAILDAHARTSTLIERMEATERRVDSRLYAILSGTLPPGSLGGGPGVRVTAAKAPPWRPLLPDLRREAERVRVIEAYLDAIRGTLEELVTALGPAIVSDPS